MRDDYPTSSLSININNFNTGHYVLLFLLNYESLLTVAVWNASYQQKTKKQKKVYNFYCVIIRL